MKFMTLTPVHFFFLFQKYLNEYGYISFSRSGNHDVSTAIRMFQEYFGLRVSGILDASTVNLMKKPRCGVPDANEGVRMQRYATLGKWSKKNLNYFVQPGQDLPHVSYKHIAIFFTSVGLKSSPDDVPVVLNDDVFFLLCFPCFLFLFSFVVFVVNVGCSHSHAHCSFSFLLLFSFPFSFSFSLRLQLPLSLSLWLWLSFLIKLSFSSTRSQDQQRKIFGDALQFWADVSGLTFNEVSTARNADIKIR